MGRPPKIDRETLHRLYVIEKKPQKEIATILQVSASAVCLALKKLGFEAAKGAVQIQTERVLSNQIDATEQLAKINLYCNELLDLLMAWNRGDEGALQILESQVRKIKIGKGEDAQEIKEYKFKDPRELALKAMAEIRGQLALQLEIFKFLYDREAFQEFKAAFLKVIGETEANVRDRIIQELQKARLLPGNF